MYVVSILIVECPLSVKFITSRCCEDLWLTNVFLKLANVDIFIRGGVSFCTLVSLFLRSQKYTVLDHRTADNGGKSVALAVCCWHFNDTSMFYLVVVLLSTSVERVSVSRMQDLLL